MRVLKLLTTGALLFVFMPFMVNAECSYAEQNRLNGLANNVKADYALSDTGDNTFVSFFNITSELYLEVNNSYNRLTEPYYYADAVDGVITFQNYSDEVVVDYKVKVYGTSADCDTKLIRSINLSVPMKNHYKSLSVCSGAEDYYLCGEYWTVDYKLSEEEFINNVKNYKASESTIIRNKTQSDGGLLKFFAESIEFVVEYWYFFLAGAINVGIVVTTIIIVVKNKKTF